MAVAAGWAAYRDPGAITRGDTLTKSGEEYARAWGYYRNAGDQVYTPAYLTGRELYRYTRLLINPVPPIVSFYEDHLFPSSPEVRNGQLLATPLAPETDDALAAAIGQLDQWSNWLSEALRLVRFCAATGDVLVENVDELDREKVTHRIVWGAWVDQSALTLDTQGNVKAYAIEYRAWDVERKENYTYRKEVNEAEFRYLKDGRPHDYEPKAEGRTGVGVITNPYGFVPAVWVRHTDDGHARGLPAVWNPDKIDELNSLVCHQKDRTRKGMEGAKVVATDGSIKSVTGASGESRAGESGGITAFDTRQDWMLLKMGADGKVFDLDSGFDPTKADSQIKRLLDSFEGDYPELQAAAVIRQNTQLSGAALERMLAPSQAKLDRAAANYHQQVIKLKQMAVAIAGWRANGQGWTRRDNQQALFKKFNLNSYRDGALDFGLRRSLLISPTADEDEALKLKQAARATQIRTLTGTLDEKQLILAGYTEEEAKAKMAEIRAKTPPVAGGTGNDSL